MDDAYMMQFLNYALKDKDSLAKALANYMFREVIEDLHTKYNISQDDIKDMCQNAVNRAAVITERLAPNNFWLGFQGCYAYGTDKWDEPNREEVERLARHLDDSEETVARLLKKYSGRNRKMPKNSIDSNDSMADFRIYLLGLGFKETTPSGLPSTIPQYCNSIKKICERENLTLVTLKENIDSIVIKYDIGGSEEEYGSKGHRTNVNALKQFQLFSKMK